MLKLMKRARSAFQMDTQRQHAEGKRDHYIRIGWEGELVEQMQEHADSLRRAFAKEKRAIHKTASRMYGPVCQMALFIDETHGLGDTTTTVSLCIGEALFSSEVTVATTRQYCGLGDPAQKLEKGKRLPVGMRFNPRLRAFILYRIADPIIKVGGPYRAVYDARKEYTLNTHPPMLEEGCEFCDAAYAGRKKRAQERKEQVGERARERKGGYDCANMGGIHWAKGHRHNDALRVIAKAVLRDLWRVTHGYTPLLERHLPRDAQKTEASVAANLQG